MVGASRRSAAPGKQFVVRFAAGHQRALRSTLAHGSEQLRSGSSSSLASVGLRGAQLPASATELLQSSLHLPPKGMFCSIAHQRLTPRSRRGPTAGHQARDAVGHIICIAGLASCLRSRLNSNVRPHAKYSYRSFASGNKYLAQIQVRAPCNDYAIPNTNDNQFEMKCAARSSHSKVGAPYKNTNASPALYSRKCTAYELGHTNPVPQSQRVAASSQIANRHVSRGARRRLGIPRMLPFRRFAAA